VRHRIHTAPRPLASDRILLLLELPSPSSFLAVAGKVSTDGRALPCSRAYSTIQPMACIDRIV
jgi:hypothetical protein